jgi:hypothetical protein
VSNRSQAIFDAPTAEVLGGSQAIFDAPTAVRGGRVVTGPRRARWIHARTEIGACRDISEEPTLVAPVRRPGSCRQLAHRALQTVPTERDVPGSPPSNLGEMPSEEPTHIHYPLPARRWFVGKAASAPLTQLLRRRQAVPWLCGWALSLGALTGFIIGLILLR